MTTISKCLAVLTMVACLAFLAFVGATAIGGPNWHAEAGQLEGFYIQQTEGENPQWVVKSRKTDEQMAQGSPVIAEAVIAARRQIRDEQEAQIQAVDRDIAAAEARLQQDIATIEVDIRAMQTRIDELAQELAAQHEEIEQLASLAVRKSQQAQVVAAEAARRREDVYRLENQLQEIRTDKFVADQQADKLRDQLVRVRGNLDRLDRRNEQLERAVKGRPPADYDEDPKAGG